MNRLRLFFAFMSLVFVWGNGLLAVGGSAYYSDPEGYESESESGSEGSDFETSETKLEQAEDEEGYAYDLRMGQGSSDNGGGEVFFVPEIPGSLDPSVQGIKPLSVPGSDFEGTWNSLAFFGMGSAVPLTPVPTVLDSQVDEGPMDDEARRVRVAISLFRGIYGQNRDHVKTSLEAGAGYGLTDYEKIEILSQAIMFSKGDIGLDIVRLLLDYFGELDCPWNASLIMLAGKWGDVRLFELLLELLPFELSLLNRSGFLVDLANYAHLEVLELLLDYGVEHERLKPDELRVLCLFRLFSNKYNCISTEENRREWRGIMGRIYALLCSNSVGLLGCIFQGELHSFDDELLAFLKFLLEGKDEEKVQMAYEVLAVAVFEADNDLLKTLMLDAIGFGMDLNAEDESGDTLLLLALRGADLSRIKILLALNGVWSKETLDQLIAAAKANGQDAIVDYCRRVKSRKAGKVQHLRYRVRSWGRKIKGGVTSLRRVFGGDEAEGIVPVILQEGVQEDEDDGCHRARKTPKKKRDDEPS